VLALLNGLLGLATLLPTLSAHWAVMLLSGLLFGGVFLSLVASTTALVRHNLPPTVWGNGISAFTIVFAFGQMVGPTVVGCIADGQGRLARGMVVSALVLWLGAVLAWRQQPAQVSRPSARSAACTAGRARIRAMNSPSGVARKYPHRPAGSSQPR